MGMSLVRTSSLRLVMGMSLVRTSSLRPWAPVPTRRACALRVQQPDCTTLAPTSAIAMAACLTPVLAKDTVCVSAQPSSRDCLALHRHLVSPWVEVSAMWRACSTFLTCWIADVMAAFALKAARSMTAELATPFLMAAWLLGLRGLCLRPRSA